MCICVYVHHVFQIWGFTVLKIYIKGLNFGTVSSGRWTINILKEYGAPSFRVYLKLGVTGTYKTEVTVYQTPQ